ncbi:MAG TPA: hypothetical protein VEH00_05755 [Steroidobacteraceae bacterium]|nr:hypothetical protein [Steroidobacteraceae bacterium]
MKSVAAAGLAALKWFVYEFLLLTILPAAGSRLASVCRVTGWIVIVASLRAELQSGLVASTGGAVLQVGVAGLTAILFGNVAKEFAFDLCARLTLWRGRAFVRDGVTMSGNRFWEIQFRDGTWMRWEREGSQATCEWTETDGRCRRLEVQAIA